MKTTLSLTEAAAFLSVTLKHLTRLLERGELSTVAGEDGPRIPLSVVKSYERKRARARARFQLAAASSATREREAIEELAAQL